MLEYFGVIETFGVGLYFALCDSHEIGGRIENNDFKYYSYIKLTRDRVLMVGFNCQFDII